MMAMHRARDRSKAEPIDQAGLEGLALFYAGRYAVTRYKLRTYLERKVRERGWAGDEPPVVDALVERCAALGYVDDQAYATAKAAALGRRGYGMRRVDTVLRAAGIEADDAAPARDQALQEAWGSALRFAERKRIGPFAAKLAGRPERDKALAAMLRAGHPMDVARRLIAAKPGEIPDADPL